MAPIPRTPSPRPRSPLDMPTQTVQFRAFSFSTLRRRFKNGNLESISPTSRAMFDHYFKKLPTPGSNNQFREPSPFYLPTSDSRSKSTCWVRLKQQQKIRPVDLPSVALPLPALHPLVPGSPYPRHSQEQQSRLNPTSDYTAKKITKKVAARKSLAKKLHYLKVRDSIPIAPRRRNNPQGSQVLGKTISLKRRINIYTKKRIVSQYGSTENSYDGQVDGGRPSEMDQGPPKKSTKRRPSTPQTTSNTSHLAPSHRQVHPLQARRLQARQLQDHHIQAYPRVHPRHGAK